MVVLAGYKTVKQALVQYADVFGHRDPILIMQEFNKGHGKHGRTFCFFGLVCERTCNRAEVSHAAPFTRWWGSVGATPAV